jgi:DNA invertase Pin-like site-specific DNA recombinase
VNQQEVIEYTRVSTKRQGNNGISLGEQATQIREVGAANNLSIMERYTDTHSARQEHESSSRPGFNEAIRRSIATGWPIIVASADRFSRTVASYDRFADAGGRLLVADIGPGAGEGVIRAVIARAEREGNAIASRTADGQKRSKRRSGNPRLAEAREQAARSNKRKARAMADKFQAEYLKAQDGGATSDVEVAEALNARGYSTSRGRAWTPTNVGRMRRACGAVEADNGAAGKGSVEAWNESMPPFVDSAGWITRIGRARLRSVLYEAGREMADIDRITDILCNSLHSSEVTSRALASVAKAEMKFAAP